MFMYSLPSEKLMLTYKKTLNNISCKLLFIVKNNT